MRLPVRDHKTPLGRRNASSETVELAQLIPQVRTVAGKPVTGRFRERPTAPWVVHVREGFLQVVPCGDSRLAAHRRSRRRRRGSVELGKHAGDLGALRWTAFVTEVTGSSRDEGKDRNGVAHPDPANRLTSRRRQWSDDEVQPTFVTKTECSVEGIPEAVERLLRCVAQPLLLAQVVDCHEEGSAV